VNRRSVGNVLKKNPRLALLAPPVLKELGGIPEARIQVGNLVIIKTQIAETPSIVVRQLTRGQVRQLEIEEIIAQNTRSLNPLDDQIEKPEFPGNYKPET
jgi:hypothetical protein